MTKIKTDTQPLSPQAQNPGGWTRVGEYTLDHLNGPGTQEGKTRLDELKETHIERGARVVQISMNNLTPEAGRWNSDNTRRNGPNGDYIYGVDARYPDKREDS